MTFKFDRFLAMVIAPVGSFLIVYFIVAFLMLRGLENVFTGVNLAVIGPGIALFCCGVYMDAWIVISKRDPQKFIKVFLWFCVCPGFLGAMLALLGICVPVLELLR